MDMPTAPKLYAPDEVSGGSPYIFISRSRRDPAAVQEVLRILRTNHYRFWYDERPRSSVEWSDILRSRIEQCTQFMVLITPSAVTSKQVRKEVAMAAELGKDVLAVYLSETPLTRSLHSLLGGARSVRRSRCADDREFERELCRNAAVRAFYGETPEAPAQTSEFRQAYELLEPIGEGGVSRVYTARQKRTGNLVAVKYCGRGLYWLNARGVESFRREKRILSELQKFACPCVPALLDWFEEEDGVYLVETLMPGKTLRYPARRTEAEVVDIAKKTLRILRELHRRCILYGDVKPANLLTDGQGGIFLVDFNSAVRLDLEDRFRGQTYAFAPPEQADCSGPPGFTADIYALGRTMEYLLAPTEFERSWRERRDRSAPVRAWRSDVSPELENVIVRMTDPSPAARYQSADEVLEALKNYRQTDALESLRLRQESRRRLRRWTEEIKREDEARTAAIRRLTGPTVRSTDDTVFNTDETYFTSGAPVRLTDDTIPPCLIALYIQKLCSQKQTT